MRTQTAQRYPSLAHSHILRATSRFHHWQGIGPLSIKTFEGGTAYYRANGGMFSVGPGSYLILNHDEHYEIMIESDTPVSSFCVFFSPGAAEEVRRSLTASMSSLLDMPDPADSAGDAVDFLVRTYAADRWITPLISRLKASGPELHGDPLWLEERTHEIAAALLLVHRGVIAEAERLPAAKWSTRAELYRRVRLAHEYVRTCYKEPLTLGDIARAACLSPNHLLRSYKRVYGTSPSSHAAELRLLEAERLLLAGRSVTDACLLVGFSSVGSFSTLFKRRFGRSPSAFSQKR
ncbi:helix-turn-helix transcriptional regulator [Paenibacillus sp. HJGM_3]|uniref:helix-turn-helix transcriptional regulator n=1 Tax=Paenibacillus sp. HJGM_3 TaxID=3379816 RepID=UPI003859112A